MTAYTTSRAAARRGLLFVVLAGVLWGTSGVATKAIYALVDITPANVAAFRLALGVPALLVAFRLTAGGGRTRVARRDLGPLIVAGAALGISQACYFASISRVGVAIATLVTICTAPVLVCLFSAVLLGERLTPAVAGALACAVLGTALLIGVGGPGSAAQGGESTLPGVALALAAAVCFAAFMLLSRRLANRYHPLQSITIAVGVGAALLLLITAVTAGVRVSYPWPAWALFLYLGLVPTALAYGLFYHGMQNATAAEGSIAALAEPLTSTVLALAIYGERLGALGVLGAALLISVIVFLYRNGS